MSEARTWTEGDPVPGPEVTAVVDDEGITWARCSCFADDPDDPPSMYWHQHLITHRGGIVLGGSLGNDWHDLWGSVTAGSTVREATAEEARTWVERWLTDDGLDAAAGVSR